MGFYNEYLQYENFDWEGFFSSITREQVIRVLEKTTLTPLDYLVLLSEQAEECLEKMAQRAHRLTVQHFGRTILLYTPLYLSNYCINQCVYCGFNTTHQVTRKQLSLEEVMEEGKTIAATGLKHILLLTGDAPSIASVDYLGACVEVLKRHFSSLSIEVYALQEEEYRQLVAKGVDGLTLYQETYNRQLYDQLHLSGPKKDYLFRLDGPERGARAGIRSLNIGALLGLDDWRREAFFTGLHAHYLQSHYPEVELGLSLPRIRPQLGGFQPRATVTDKNLVQMMTAFRLFMPRVGITLSTREGASFRDNAVPLGITKMSAGSTTAVGGHSQGEAGGQQFAVSDHRSVAEMKIALQRLGYQPLFKDWHPLEEVGDESF